MAKQPKLNYRFYNPNTPEATAEHVYKVFLEVNKRKMDRVLQEAAHEMQQAEQQPEPVSVKERLMIAMDEIDRENSRQSRPSISAQQKSVMER